MVSMLSLMSSRLPQHFRRASPLAKTWSCKLVLGQRSEDRNAITPGCRCKTCENGLGRGEPSRGLLSCSACRIGYGSGPLSGYGDLRGICELSGLASIQSTRYPWSSSCPIPYRQPTFFLSCQFHCCFSGRLQCPICKD